MELSQYQHLALRTKKYSEIYTVIYPALKLNGEAGEVAEKIGKTLRDDNGVFTIEKKLEIAKELGDVLWYIAALAHDIGYNLEEIAQINIDKLASRDKREVISGSGDNR